LAFAEAASGQRGMSMSQNSDAFNPFDPTGMFKNIRDANLDACARMMIDLVNTDAYSRATGVMLDAWLSNSAPFRKALESALAQALAGLNMPARADVIGLAERLTNVETRLDDLDAKLDEVLKAVRARPGARARAGNGEGHS
jgi:hypothetical protein